MSQDLPVPRQDRPAGRPEPTPDRPLRPAGPADDAPEDIETTADGATVVSWGDPPRTGRRAGLALARIGRDGRLVPVVAVLGAGAIFASLIGDWTITSMPSEGVRSDGPVELASGVADLEAFGSGYLLGVLALVGCAALVFFGTPGVRHNARVLGLACTGATLGLLAVITGSLDALTDRWQMYGELEGLVVAYGQGLVCAYLGVGGLGLALLLAGRFVRRPATEPEPAEGAGAPTGSVDPVAVTESDWPWRRPQAATPDRDFEDDDRSAPIDLTVTPTKPFTH